MACPPPARRFQLWKDLVDEAVRRGQKLVVFYMAGHLRAHGAEKTTSTVTRRVEGEVGWGELPELGTLPQGAARQLWDKVGLGGSQKGEVAYLQRMGYAYTRLDVMDGAPTADEAGALLAARAREMEGALRGAIAGAGAPAPGGATAPEISSEPSAVSPFVAQQGTTPRWHAAPRVCAASARRPCLALVNDHQC